MPTTLERVLLDIQQGRTHIYAKGNELSNDDIVTLAATLERNTTAISFTLSMYEKGFNTDAILSIRSMIEKNTSLHHIDLLHTKVSNTDVAAIAEGIKKNKYLESISLVDNEIGDTGATDVALAAAQNPRIKVIELRANNISETGATAIAAALEQHPSLSEIDLNSNDIGDTGARAIATLLEKNATLKKVDLSYCDIIDAGITAIADALKKSRSVQELKLGYNSFGAAGLSQLTSALENNTSLRSLELSGNTIGAAGAQLIATAMKKNNSLTELYLHAANINAAGATDIAAALEKNTSLTKIELSGNNIGSIGAAAIATALEKNRSLTDLTLSFCGIDDAGALAIASALDTNTSLTKLEIDNVGLLISQPVSHLINCKLERNKRFQEASALLRDLDKALLISARDPRFHTVAVGNSLRRVGMIINELAEGESKLPEHPSAQLNNHWLLCSLQFMLGAIDPLTIDDKNDDSLINHPQFVAALDVFKQMDPASDAYRLARRELTRQLIMTASGRESFPSHMKRALQFFENSAPLKRVAAGDADNVRKKDEAEQQDEIEDFVKLMKSDPEYPNAPAITAIPITTQPLDVYKTRIALKEASVVARAVNVNYQILEQEREEREPGSQEWLIKAANQSRRLEQAEINLRELIIKARLEVLQSEKEEDKAAFSSIHRLNALKTTSFKPSDEKTLSAARVMTIASLTDETQRALADPKNAQAVATLTAKLTALDEFFNALNGKPIANLARHAPILEQFPALDTFVKGKKGALIAEEKVQGMKEFLVFINRQNTTLAHLDTLKPLVESAKNGIKEYQQDPKLKKTFGFFSFKANNVDNQADFYLDRLNNAADRKQQALTLYALLASHDTQPLTSAVCAKLPGSAQPNDARKIHLDLLKKMLIEIYRDEDSQRDEPSIKNAINQDIQGILDSAETHRPNNLQRLR